MVTINTYISDLIQTIKLSARYSTAGIYTSAFNSFMRFTKNPDLAFQDLTPGMMKQYEEHLLQIGNRHNTISTYMRMLRSIFNQAEEEGISMSYGTEELFRFVFTGYEPTTKRAVSPSLLRRIALLDLDAQPKLRFSRDLFLLSFYLRGIPFVDLAYLRKSDVRYNTIYYYRKKTRQQLSVHIEKCAKEILDRYSTEDIKVPYLLPILKSTGEKAHLQYKSALRLYNKHLHKLSDILGLRVSLTSYVARHSWATAAKNEGVAISIISESLGHTSEKVTHVYLASFENNAMSKANRKVIATINTDKIKK